MCGRCTREIQRQTIRGTAQHIPPTPPTRSETDAECHRQRQDQFFSSAAATPASSGRPGPNDVA